MGRDRPATRQVEPATSSTSAVSLLRWRGNAADLEIGSADSRLVITVRSNLSRSTGYAGSSTFPLSLWCRRTMCSRSGEHDRRPTALVLAPSAFTADRLLLVALDLATTSAACPCEVPGPTRPCRVWRVRNPIRAQTHSPGTTGSTSSS
jgi:hypothetical protein